MFCSECGKEAAGKFCWNCGAPLHAPSGEAVTVGSVPAPATALASTTASAVSWEDDFDYERWPTPEDHPFRGCEILREHGYPEWVTRAILSHADYSGVPRESRLEKTLWSCDEMAGFVTAASLVRPSRSILDLEPSSVMKRMKDKAFARAVKREDLKKGAEGLGLPLEQHIGNVITFMRERADALGLRGTL